MQKSEMSTHRPRAKMILGNKDSADQRFSSYFFSVLTKYLCPCHLCPETLEKAKNEGDGLANPVGEISRQALQLSYRMVIAGCS